jgi:hypothetical protein
VGLCGAVFVFCVLRFALGHVILMAFRSNRTPVLVGILGLAGYVTPYG